MKKQMLLMLFPLLLLLVLVWTNSLSGIQQDQKTTETLLTVTDIKQGYENIADANDASINQPINTNSKEDRQEVVSYAMSFLGTPYVYAGMSPNGFDCSGFITYVYQNFHMDLPHSSAMQAKEGRRVSKNEATTGDLVIFTGTNPRIRKPGHVGIVISLQGDTIEFIHSSSSSSKGGVKISKVQGTRYDKRFLEVRRIL